MSGVASILSALQPTRLVSDSRRIQPGDTFVAYPGELSDGRKYIPQALANGAQSVLWEQEGFSWSAEWKVKNLPVPQLREQIGPIASAFYGKPSQKSWMVGVTGTNGKTSCSHWLAQAMTQLGRKAAVVGTLGNGFPGALAEAINTTPDPIQLQGMLADYHAQGAQAIAMEVSSHGLAQGRVNGTHFDVAVLTNLTRDHLDYHGDMASYAAAKKPLFFWPELKCAVLNNDDEFGAQLVGQLKEVGVKVMTYGFADADVRGSRLRLRPDGLAFDITTDFGMAYVSAPVMGRFNVSNMLAVLTALLASNYDLQESVAALSEIKPVAGRMQSIGGNGKPVVVVDYAHTPDALEKVLTSLREQTQGKLLCVFGCGGNRDKGKRPQMGEVASRLADVTIVTSDNPRHEEPQEIISQVIAGMAGDYHIEADRAAAIDQAIHQAAVNDIVLIAGKGHEDYQQIGDTRYPFSDIEVAARVLDKMKETA